MSRSPDEGRYRHQPETINEYLQQNPDDDPLGLRHLGDEELEDRLVRLSLSALTSASGPETAVRVDSGCHPSPHRSDDAPLLHVSSERGDLPA